jgi:energy-coupling factor transporter ATP-binding protein EcfA2
MILNTAIFGEKNSGKSTLFNILNEGEQYNIGEMNVTKFNFEENTTKLVETIDNYDIIIYLITYNYEASNYDTLKQISNMIDNNNKLYNKIVKLVVLFNKCDLDDNFGPNDSQLSNQKKINQQIDYIKKNINSNIQFLQTSLLFTQMYLKIKFALENKKYDEVQEDTINKVGIWLNGRGKWKKLTATQRKSELTKYFKNLSYNDIYTTEFSSNLNKLSDLKLDEVALGRVNFFSSFVIDSDSIDDILKKYSELYVFLKTKKLKPLRLTLIQNLKEIVQKFLNEVYNNEFSIMTSKFEIIEKILGNKKCFENDIIQIHTLTEYKHTVANKICTILLQNLEQLKQSNEFNSLFENISLLSKYGYDDIEEIVTNCVLNNQKLNLIVKDDDETIIQCCNLIKQNCGQLVVLTTAYQLLISKYKQSTNITYLFLAKDYFNSLAKKENYPMILKMIYILEMIINKTNYTIDDIDTSYIKKARQDGIFSTKIFQIENYVKELQFNITEIEEENKLIHDSDEDDEDDENENEEDTNVEEQKTE